VTFHRHLQAKGEPEECETCVGLKWSRCLGWGRGGGGADSAPDFSRTTRSVAIWGHTLVGELLFWDLGESESAAPRPNGVESHADCVVRVRAVG
jgi:hypothetical protein